MRLKIIHQIMGIKYGFGVERESEFVNLKKKLRIRAI